MIHALGYEPQGQRQRFEPREQQCGEQRDRHIHLHFHLNLTFRAKRERSTHPNAFRLRRIFAALLAATVMFPLIFLYTLLILDGQPPNALENLMLIMCGVSFITGLALAWCAIGALLYQVWRVSPRGRLGMVLPLILLLLFLLVATRYGVVTHGAISPYLLLLVALPFSVVLIVHPVIAALLLMWVSRETLDLRQQAPIYSKLGLAVVAGMGLMFLGGLFFNLLVLPIGGMPLLIFLPAICLAVIVAVHALFGLFHSPGSMQARPKDASPFDSGSTGEY